MIRILAALSISLAVVIAYTVLAAIISSFILGEPVMMAMDPRLGWPLSLPGFVYANVAPDVIQNATLQTPGAHTLLFFLGNVLIYSIPIYVLLSIFKRRRARAGSSPEMNAEH